MVSGHISLNSSFTSPTSSELTCPTTLVDTHTPCHTKDTDPRQYQVRLKEDFTGGWRVETWFALLTTDS